jgi:hypothetical protein
VLDSQDRRCHCDLWLLGFVPVSHISNCLTDSRHWWRNSCRGRALSSPSPDGECVLVSKTTKQDPPLQ